MRRLFGLKSTKATSPSPLESVTNGEKGSSVDLARPYDPAAKQHHGLGLGLDTTAYEGEQAAPVRKSRHVHYDTEPSASEASSSSSQPSSSTATHSAPPPRRAGPTAAAAPPPLHPQPSFESRHGGTAASNCFPLPRSGSDSHASTASAPTPQAPAPLRHATAQSEHTANSIDVQRTTSPLSFSPSGASYSTAGRGASPYSYGVQANPSLARLAERDPSQIYVRRSDLWAGRAADGLSVPRRRSHGRN